MSPYPALLSAAIPAAKFASTQLGRIAKSGIDAFHLGLGNHDTAVSKISKSDSAKADSVAQLNSTQNDSPTDLAKRLESLLVRLQQALQRSGATPETVATLQADGNQNVRIIDGGGYGDELDAFLSANPDIQIELNSIINRWRNSGQLPISTTSLNLNDDARRNRMVLSISPSKTDWQWAS